MAVKTFTSGAILTASDTNTYLANAGLVYVTSVTVGSGVTSIPVTGCFSSTYDNYRVLYNIQSASANGNLMLQFNNATGNTYYAVGIYFGWGNTTANNYAPAVSDRFLVGTTFASDSNEGSFDVMQPNLPRKTFAQGQNCGNAFGMWVNGLENSGNVHTGFTLYPSTGNVTGGTITVYGYRKA